MGSTFSGYLLSSIFMLVILGMLIARSYTAIKETQSRNICIALIGATALYVIMDAVFISCHLLGLNAKIWNVVSYFFYVAYVVLPFVWHLFVRNFVGSSLKPVYRVLECVPLFILLLLICITPFTGAVWTFTDSGAYDRGYLFTFYSYLNYFYYLEPILDIIIIYATKREKNEHYALQSIFISLVPLIGAVINNRFLPVGTIFPFQPFCSVVVAMLSFFFIATKDSDKLKDEQQQAIKVSLDKAEEASRVKTQFLSDMSHDIRTPINAIISLNDLALKEPDASVVHSYLGKMKIAENFLLGLINDILDVSRIESGEVVLHKENLTRTEFLKTVNAIIDPLIKSKKIHYHPEINPGEHTISVDKLRFNQIFFNLLSNAVKYTPEGGDVWFEVHNLEADNNTLKIRFVVRDNGVGMSESFMKRLFEPFAREQSDYNRKVQGTGLGLSIVKGLVDTMGGTITVQSELGKGSEFDVVFPVEIVAHEELIPEEKSVEELADLKGLRVLLVEDNELNTFVTKTILEQVGCVVSVADNGKTAVDTFLASEPFSIDAILMDIRMPVMNGLEATSVIRSSSRADAQSVPIIAVTADVFDDGRKDVLASGVSYFLPKPINAEKLYSALKECVSTPPPRKTQS